MDAPTDPRAPMPVVRGMVEDINKFPFPSDTPVPYAEAVFDRAGVEIARGCTEGCRFCQAGMIYRPVRERSPESIIKTVLDGVDKAGYDETGLTSLSTADYSCITPLVSTVMKELRKRKVSMSVSSLRAYGLGEDILDEMASMRITGLTFAPEAGTQRMRDVVNKNVTEAHITESAERIFARGWQRVKLYFMIGLPTEQAEDVRGIVETGERLLRIGRKHVGNRVQVTVSASSHVPKPHTPFQWCRQDSLQEIADKQRLLRDTVTERGLRLKYHDRNVSFLEGVIARGDRPLADAIELAWKRGARFDGWDEHFDLDLWTGVFDELNIDAQKYLLSRPVTARLPWDHIDVGLEDGFLLKEYRKALKNRLSPPCGKVAGDLVHPSNLVDAAKQTKRLVCYDCGIACDLTQMKDQRTDYLVTLGAEKPMPKRELPVRVQGSAKKPEVSFPDLPKFKYRLVYSKNGRTAFLGHLDMIRVLPRLFRRAGLQVAYSRGYHPKPIMSFAPALSLGVPGLGEIMDISLETPLTAQQVLDALRSHSPEGIDFVSAQKLPTVVKSMTHSMKFYDMVIKPAPDGMSFDDRRLSRIKSRFDKLSSAIVVRKKKEKKKEIDVRQLVEKIEVWSQDEASTLCTVLGWPKDSGLLFARVKISNAGSVKPIEVAKALGVYGDEDPRAEHALVARLGFPGVAFVDTAEPSFATMPQEAYAASRTTSGGIPAVSSGLARIG